MTGVATPSDLIKNKNTTPYNIGTAIELAGFTFEEAKKGLLQGFKDSVNNSEQVLKDILWWTGGQPFLTQKICQLVAKQKERSPDLTKLVQTKIIEGWVSQDKPQHLRTIEDRITINYRLMEKMLTIYQSIWQGDDVNVDNSDAQRQLLLSGLVVKARNKLKVYNPIYREVFDSNWIDEQFKTARSAENLMRRLSDLGEELHKKGHRYQRDEALRIATLAKEFRDPKVEKIMLLSQISFAYLELGEFEKAAVEAKFILEYLDNNQEFRKIEEEIENATNDLDNEIKIDFISQKLQTLVYVYHTQGSLSLRQGMLKNALQAYLEAFAILKNTLEKKISILNQEILPLEIVESIHNNSIDLIESFENRQDIDFTTNDVRLSLIQYLFVHYAPIKELLKAKEWKKADEETYRMMTQKVGKEGIQMLVRSDFEVFPLEDLYVVNALWEKYSDGKFGFRRQKEIWGDSGGKIGERRLAPVIEFWQAVGWVSEGELSEIELNEINYQSSEDIPDGHLPTTGLRFQEVSLLSRFAECNINFDISFFDSLIR